MINYAQEQDANLVRDGCIGENTR